MTIATEKELVSNNTDTNDLDLEDLEDLDDFELTKKTINYEIWVLGYDSDYQATDFEYNVDSGYTDRLEAKKCFDYFSNKDVLLTYLKHKNVVIDENTKHLHLFLEMCFDVDGVAECQDISDEVEIY